ncbi:MAG: cyclase family protein [Peptostreptococcaceae bacterium]|nr:cyclase family protein [Peptostreptococcaceae bacterium]
MKVIDLTHRIEEGMPVYPGTEGPKLRMANSYEKDGFKETLLRMYSHTGTHMDAPSHLYAQGRSLDEFSVSRFVGLGVVIDCLGLREGDKIGMSHIERQREEAEKADFLLFCTGWDKYWGSEKYFGDYPTIDEEVARYIAEKGKKGVGLDVIGLDPIGDADLPLHKIVLRSNETVIIENLKNLSRLGRELFTFCALPLHYIGGDGAPIRAVAIFDREKEEKV